MKFLDGQLYNNVNLKKPDEERDHFAISFQAERALAPARELLQYQARHQHVVSLSSRCRRCLACANRHRRGFADTDTIDIAFKLSTRGAIHQQQNVTVIVFGIQWRQCNKCCWWKPLLTGFYRARQAQQ